MRVSISSATLLLSISLVRARVLEECELKCGGQEGDPTLCLKFCAQSFNLPVFAFFDGQNDYERILGGQELRPGTFPFLASLKVKWGIGTHARNFVHFCGGSVISTTYILTAAHCVVDMIIERLWVSIGDYNTRILDTNEKIIQADKIIIHIRYNPKNFQNDIGK